jgi:excisionase family DNA binding protein
MKLKIDRSANAAYIKITNKPVKETKAVSEYCHVDLDANGVAVGIELLFVSESLDDFKFWLDLNGAAQYFQMSPETIRRWTKSGQLASYKIGRDYRFKKEDLDSFIERHKVVPAH